MSFDLVYYNDNSFFVEDSINHFLVSNQSTNKIINENLNNPKYFNEEEIKFIANKVSDITKNNKNISNDQLVKIIVFVILISQILLLFQKMKT